MVRVRGIGFALHVQTISGIVVPGWDKYVDPWTCLTWQSHSDLFFHPKMVRK